MKLARYVRKIQRSSESILTMLASEDILKKDWENEADERWNTI